MNAGSGLMSSSTPANLMWDDCFEDACSICLEPFTATDPSSVTKCKHEYHLHCILEWCQRRIECPICCRHLVLGDPASQELLAVVESERNLRLSKSNTANQENSGVHAHGSALERRIMRRLADIATRARSIGRRRRQRVPADSDSQLNPSHPPTNMPDSTQIHRASSQHQNLADCSVYVDSSSSGRSARVSRAHSPTLFHSFSQSASYNTRRSSSSDFAAFSESLKSKISIASTRYKESISKSMHNLKEKLNARNHSVKELSKGVQREMSAGIAGISRMMHRDISQKRSGVSAPLPAMGPETILGRKS